MPSECSTLDNCLLGVPGTGVFTKVNTAGATEPLLPSMCFGGFGSSLGSAIINDNFQFTLESVLFN